MPFGRIFRSRTSGDAGEVRIAFPIPQNAPATLPQLEELDPLLWRLPPDSDFGRAQKSPAKGVANFAQTLPLLFMSLVVLAFFTPLVTLAFFALAWGYVQACERF